MFVFSGGGWRWKTPGGRCPCHTAQSVSGAPTTVQRGFGRPGGLGRYRPATLKCSMHHGPIRAGCPGWLLRGWLHCAKTSKGPGSSCGGRAGVIIPAMPVRPGAGHTGGFEFGAEGHRGLLGSVRPLHEGAYERPARFALWRRVFLDLRSLTREETCSRPPGKRRWRLIVHGPLPQEGRTCVTAISRASSIAWGLGEG